MSWGNKLLFTFIAFAGLMITLVYKCTQNTVDLVSADYYADELRYQDKIDGMNNAAKIGRLAIDQNAANLIVKMPQEMSSRDITGEAWFYCSTNAAMDRKIKLAVDKEGKQFIDKGELAKTSYIVKINWKAGDQLYYSEQTITIQ